MYLFLHTILIFNMYPYTHHTYYYPLTPEIGNWKMPNSISKEQEEMETKESIKCALEALTILDIRSKSDKRYQRALLLKPNLTQASKNFRAPDELTKRERRRQHKRFMTSLFEKKEAKEVNVDEKKSRTSRHQFKLCYYDEKSSEKSVVPMAKNSERQYSNLADSFVGREIKEFGLFPKGVDRLIFEYTDDHYFGNTAVVQFESKKRHIDFTPHHEWKKLSHSIVGKKCLVSMLIKIQDKTLDIPHCVPDVAELGVLSERDAQCQVLDWRHFVVVFDHRVDFYHIGEKQLTRIYTIRPERDADRSQQGNASGVQGHYRYGFSIRDGCIKVCNAYHNSRSELLRLPVFPLNCHLCGEH